MRSSLPALILTLAIGCDYEAPTLPPDGFEGLPNVISGTVVANGVEADELANVILLLTEASNPGPPAGTGRPLTFAAVNAEDFTGSGGGLQSASFTISNVPDGEYILTGFMDMDNDFHPLVDAFSGATCGDLLGGHLADVTSTDFAVISVSGGELLDDVTVALALELTTERPAFWLPEVLPIVSRQAAIDTPAIPQTFRIEAAPVHAQLSDLSYSLEGPYDPEAPAACQTSFLTIVADNDLDGLPDPHPEYGDLGFFDVGPSVFLTYLGEVIFDETTGAPIGFDDSALAVGESWNAQALVHPQMMAFGQLPPPNVPAPLSALDLIWLPGALHNNPDGTVDTVLDPLAIPAGGWSISVIMATGQTWTVPNSLLYSAPTEDDFYPLTQGGFLYVQ